MSLGNSRYVKKQKKNPWREVVLSEAMLIEALTNTLRITTHLKGTEKIERLIVGEPHAGQYPLSVAIVKTKED